MEDFTLPFGGKLNSENRWIKLAQITPWDKIEDFYTKVMCGDCGRTAYTARIAFGSIFIKQSEKLSEEGVVVFIQENPYAQYYLGLHEFKDTPLFDSSMMVYFRRRFPVEFVTTVNDLIMSSLMKRLKLKLHWTYSS